MFDISSIGRRQVSNNIASILGGVVLFAVTSARLLAQDILINDFEGTTFAPWTTTGTAFGSGPVTGPVSGQGAVAGFVGSRFADSYNGGDASTGTLTSPAFTIQRNYIRFLIGGGNQRGQTCINLIVNGQVVRSAVGMGDREDLSALQWNVSDLIGSNATIQVVDNHTGGWGHINVDQIVQSNTSLTNVFTASQHYLNLPVSIGGSGHLIELVRDGLVEHEFNINLTTSTPDFYAFLDLTAYQGKEFLVRVDSQPASAAQLAAMVQSNNIIAATPIYQEALRPIYHYSARRGFVNDPNGMVFYNGEYHFAYQHNPYELVVGNQHWGNAVSTDLVHWTELPESIYPDWRGQAWSGSSVVDWNNTAGFGANAIVSFYTAAGGHGNNPRMSLGQLFTQGMAYSLDADRTLIKYTNNPVVPNVVGDNRDPRVIWYAPGNKWVMVLWLQNSDFGFFSSTDLKHWTQTFTFAFGNGVIEVPELFQLALDGNTNNLKWIFYAGAGNYYVGTFDGNTFTAQNGPFSIRKGNSFAAAQTFNNMPASDGRRILMANGTGEYPNMPFDCAMTFPVELTLTTSGGNPLIYCNPVREIALLRTSTNTWTTQTLTSGANIMSGTTGEAFELDSYFQPGTATSLTFTLRGTTVTYNRSAQTVSCAGSTQTLAPISGVVHLRMLVDRGTIEIFGNDGLVYMSMSVTPTAGAQAVSLVATGSGATLNSMSMYNLGSAWVSPAPATNVPPSISIQPTPQPATLGSPATFSVTAGGTAPLAYQWRFNSVPLTADGNISMVTNGSLTISSVAASNLGNFDVVITNNYGAITSSAAGLTLQAPGINSQPVSQTVPLGSAAMFTVGATGSGPLAYQWRFNGVPLGTSSNIASVTNSTLTISPTYATNAGNYDVVITNNAGAVTSSPSATLSFHVPNISSPPSPVTANLGGPATFSVTASGGSPIYYQWRRGGAVITGATNATLNLFPIAADYAGNQDVVVSIGALSVTSAPALLTVRPPFIAARWQMEAQATTPNSAGSPSFNGVQDVCTNVGQGIVAVGGVVPAARDDLITFNSLSGNPVVLSNSVPPIAMFANSNSPGMKSFNAGAYTGDGALFFPQDQYGNEFSFNSPFSIELFFKTYDDQSLAGKMQVVMQGETTFRYGIVMNESVPGSVRFMVTNGAAGQVVAALTNANYADGQWHYLLAVYDTLSGSNGQVRLTIINTNGAENAAVTDLPGGFGVLPSGNDGNLFLGRFKYPIAQEHRTFLGLLDEVQITAGVVSNSWRLGKIASLDTSAQIQITGVTNTGTGIGFQWASIAGQNYEVQWTGQLGNVWQAIITVLACGASSNFTDTNLTRLNQPTGFYRIFKP